MTEMFLKHWGFVPRVFSTQTAVPGEALLIEALVFRATSLPRAHKELILATAAHRLGNTYWLGIHIQMLDLLGWPAASAVRADSDEALLLVRLGFALDQMARQAAPEADFAARPLEVEMDLARCWSAGATELARALAARPDVASCLDSVNEAFRRAFHSAPPPVVAAPENFPHPPELGPRPTECEVDDPDALLVLAAQSGHTDAFEELVRKHGRRVYRTLAGILGEAEDARDAMQDTFLKAFHRLDSFERRSKFSTWVISIGVNLALERLRARRPTESLDELLDDGEGGFRPRLVQAWGDTPEQRFGKQQMRELVQREVRKLPVKYRTIVVLRDIEHLSTQEAAGALGLAVPAAKSRLLRARLMLREALSPHFAQATGARQ